MVAGWFMLRAHRIVRAQLAQIKRAPDRLVDSAAHLDQPAQRALSVRCPGVKQDAVPDLRSRVNALADRTGWIAAPQRYRCDQQMGEDRKSTRLNSSHLGISYAV